MGRTMCVGRIIRRPRLIDMSSFLVLITLSLTSLFTSGVDVSVLSIPFCYTRFNADILQTLSLKEKNGTENKHPCLLEHTPVIIHA